MRILILTSEVWNDRIYGNNVISNWFEGMEAEFANIYGSPCQPDNQSCSRYFQVTDSMMAKSILTGKRAGKILEKKGVRGSRPVAYTAEAEPEKLYAFLKSISGSFLRFVREMLWMLGRYDRQLLRQFIDDFQPDIIFSIRMASCKMLRMERTVSRLCDAPMAAFTGDDEYSLRQASLSPFFWINRVLVRRMLQEQAKTYRLYYTLSSEQKRYYEKRLACPMKILRKCADSSPPYQKKAAGNPIRIIYAGKLYCGRWKVLARIAGILEELNHNQNERKAVLEIYTMDSAAKKQRRLLDNRKSSYLMGGVSQEALKEIYGKADIALHVESRELPYRLKTRFSFSTKIIDCLCSGCAVLAYCWEGQSGWAYLKREDAAICASNDSELKKALACICKNPRIIQKYAKKAYACAQKNQKKDVQEMLLADFQAIIDTGRYMQEGIKE